VRPFILIVGGSGPSLECGDVEESEVFIGGTGEDIRGFEVDRCNSMIVGISTYTGMSRKSVTMHIPSTVMVFEGSEEFTRFCVPESNRSVP